MILTSLTVSNYKSFMEAGTVAIAKGFNLFLGANNSGKTTMLEALDLDPHKSLLHRSIFSLPEYGDQPHGESNLRVTIKTSLPELRKLVGETVMIPIPVNYRDMFGTDANPVHAAHQAIMRNPEIILELENGNGRQYVSTETVLGKTERDTLMGPEASTHLLQLRFLSRDSQKADCNVLNVGGVPSQIRFSDAFRPFFYRFSAQRNPTIHSGFSGTTTTLLPDASNLAFCLSQLQLNDAHAHSQLCDWINRVFPSVKWVQAPAISNNSWLIQCLPRPPHEQRNDMAVTLDQMGTGIGNVIAILYIIQASRRPQVIAIDEPNSFLHPRALRELLQILVTEGSQHQYILTAHSADVLTAVDPSLITMFAAPDGRTSIRQVRGEDIVDLRMDLSDLGIRMTDLHGRDRVLWVEGQTEELIVPELLRRYCPALAAGTAVLRVEHTGTFEKKGIEVSEVVKLYERLSQSSALVPPMVAILLDRESRTERESERLIADCKGTLRLLDRPMLEDYIMNAQAICARLTTFGEQCTENQVQEIINTKGLETKSSANLLAQIFYEVSESRHQFRKTRDVPAIITWLISNEPDFLAPLGACLTSLFVPMPAS